MTKWADFTKVRNSFLSCGYFHADWDDLCNHLRDLPWEHIFKLGISETAAEFCNWIQVGIDVYIPHHKYQVNHRSSPWFFAADVAAIAHGNHLDSMHQRNISAVFESKLIRNFSRLLIVTKGFLNLTNILMLIKHVSAPIPRNIVRAILANC